MTPPTVVSAGLGRHRRASALAFASQGLVFISLTTRLPDFADRWNLGELELSLLLLLMVLLAGVGSVAAERLAARRDSATVLRAGLLLTAVAVPTLALAPAHAAFVLGLAAYGVALGVVDATANMQAVAIEHGYGRPILPSFHGAWTAGGVVGATLTLATSGLPSGSAAAVAALPLAVAVTAGFLPRAEVPGEGVAVTVPWRPIVLVGLGMVVFYMVDTAATTWGATYLDDTVVAPSGLVALATLPYLLASLVVRLAGDRLVQTHGVVVVLRTGAVVACVGLVTVVLAPAWPVAVLGFTVTGAGVAVVAPLSFSAAARIAGGSPAQVDAVVARFNQFNYLGALLGAVLTGVVGSDSLRVGFAVPAVLVLALVPLARAFAADEPGRQSA
ncbi:MFS transporter [Nocardioides dongxiaopingii]|uniref:MFS transporter n=1 Tax=Nocardioides sp. S-1144 TaxID=2582905 RepID=UPI001C9E3A26|nr:MFS transporter [Nocardioides sp. S-1144]